MSGVLFASASGEPVAPIPRRAYISRLRHHEEMRELLQGDLMREVSTDEVKTILARRIARRTVHEGRALGSARLFDKGRDAFAEKLIGWTADTQKALLLDLSVAGTFNKIITGVTAASPAVYTSNGHGFSNGDTIVNLSILGTLTANQLGLAAAVAANTYQMTTLAGAAVNGTGAYVSGGFAVNLTQAQFVAGILGTRVSTDQTLAGTSSSKGIVNATSPVTWPNVPIGNPAQAVVLYDAAGGSDAANRLVLWQDGRIQVTLNKAAIAGDTSLSILPLKAQIWDGAIGAAPVLSWSDGHSSVLAATTAAGDLAITTTAQAVGGVAAGSTAEVPVFGTGLPVTPGGGNIVFTIGSILYVGTGFFQL